MRYPILRKPSWYCHPSVSDVSAHGTFFAWFPIRGFAAHLYPNWSWRWWRNPSRRRPLQSRLLRTSGAHVTFVPGEDPDRFVRTSWRRQHCRALSANRNWIIVLKLKRQNQPKSFLSIGMDWLKDASQLPKSVTLLVIFRHSSLSEFIPTKDRIID